MKEDAGKILHTSLSTACCITGGGPAGIVLGYLLARAGIDVTVIEKWPDFFRDFRGDTIHPSTMQLLHELGILEKFLTLKHSETRQVAAHVGGRETIVADFSHLPLKCPFIAFIPQWDFLNFMCAEAGAYPGFHLYTQTEAVDLIRNGEVVEGVKVNTPAGSFDIRARLTIAADGRHSVLRQKAGLPLKDFGAPIDVLWFRLSRTTGKMNQSLGYIDKGKILIMLDRDDYWQCGFVINKGDTEGIKLQGLDAFKAGIVQLAPFLAGVVEELRDWEQVKTLSVAVDHLAQWYLPGLLCIGDSAHAMSPVGGVGINLAIQDAVAAANILIPAFKSGGPAVKHLRAVQRRRSWPARMVQHVQVAAHKFVIAPVIKGKLNLQNPWPLRLLRAFPVLRRLPAYAIGIGLRPEHFTLPG